MNINSVNRDLNLYNSTSTQVDKKSQAQDSSSNKSTVGRRADTLELSPEASSYNPIKSRINSGYYDKPEIVRELALRLSRNFPPENGNK